MPSKMFGFDDENLKLIYRYGVDNNHIKTQQDVIQLVEAMSYPEHMVAKLAMELYNSQGPVINCRPDWEFQQKRTRGKDTDGDGGDEDSSDSGDSVDSVDSVVHGYVNDINRADSNDSSNSDDSDSDNNNSDGVDSEEYIFGDDSFYD